jgi:hypothetical protein
MRVSLIILNESSSSLAQVMNGATVVLRPAVVYFFDSIKVPQALITWSSGRFVEREVSVRIALGKADRRAVGITNGLAGSCDGSGRGCR